MKSMQETMLELCSKIQGCVFGYTQSDEITLILIDYQCLNTAAWFDYEVQKLCSIAASMATLSFNKHFMQNVTREIENYIDTNWNISQVNADNAYHNVLVAAAQHGALFDARAFNIPKEEVTNLVYWRQLDATRNSIQMVGQAMFPHAQLQNKSCNKIQDMLMEEKHINWNAFSVMEKRGTACIKDETGKWKIDYNMPILKGKDRQYVDKLIFIGE